jgi:hypothetical protein
LIGKSRTTKKGSREDGASLRILPLAEITMKEGESKFLIVQIQREKFAGPVTVRIKNLPDGVQAAPVTIPEDRDRADVRLTVSFGAGSIRQELRVLAATENLSAETRLPFTVVGTPRLPPRQKGR